MKKLILILVIPILIISCNSPKKITTERERNAYIVKLVDKLEKNPNNKKNINYLSEQIAILDKTDLRKIKELRLSGQPDIWLEIFKRYSRLKYRQDLVIDLPANVLQEINFRKHDYSKDIETTRIKAANYLYAESQLLLENGDDLCSNLAKINLLKITSLYENYRDVDKLLRKSIIYGSKNVLYRFYNKSKIALPDYQKEYLRSIEISENSFFDFDNVVIPDKDYDLSIVLTITKINILKGKDSQKSYFVNKGPKENPHKYKCRVIEIFQDKTVKISGDIEYYDNNTSKQVYTKPFAVKTNFNYKYARLDGDQLACSPEIIELAKKKRVVLPSNNNMLEDAVVKLKTLVETLILAD